MITEKLAKNVSQVNDEVLKEVYYALCAMSETDREEIISWMRQHENEPSSATSSSRPL